MKKAFKLFTVCILIIAFASLVSACSEKKLENIKAENVEVVYNGETHSIVVDGTNSGDTITYSTSKEGIYAKTNPSFTDVGEYIVYFKVARAKHKTYEGKATVSITSALITITPDELEKNIGEDDPILSYTYSGNIKDETPAFTGALTRETGETVGSYEVLLGTLTLADNEGFKASNYTLTLAEVDFVINEKTSLTDAVITLSNNEFVYTGEAIQPVISQVLKNETEISADSYTVSYTDNINAGTATVIITGTGNFTGTASKNFVINPTALTVTPDSLSKIEGEDDPAFTYTYSNNVVGETPVFTGALTRETGEDVGSYEVLIGTLALADNQDFKADNYTLVLENVDFLILDNFDVNNAIVTLEDLSCVYNGQNWQPAVEQVMLNGSALTLNDYNVTYSNNIDAGDAIVTINGIGDYFGQLDTTFTISPATLTVTPDSLSKIENEEDPIFTYTYSGNITDESPAFTGSLTRETGEDTGNYKILIGTLALTDNEGFKADNYTLSLTEVNFVINEKISLSNAVITLINDEYEYIGEVIQPEISQVLLNELEISADSYIVSYTDNINAGTATVTITGVGIYTDTASQTFTITAKDISDATITLNYSSVEYDGTAKEPNVTNATINGLDITYSATYSDNTNVGTATVTITANGNFSGIASQNFVINAATLTVTPDSLSKIEGEEDPAFTYTYSGNIAGETPAFSGVLERQAGENVGSYEILIGTLALMDNEEFKVSNYILVLDAVYFTIDPFEITVQNGYDFWWEGDSAVQSNVSVNALEGDTVEYSVDGANWYEDQSNITFNESGAHLIFIKISRDEVEIANKAAFMLIEEIKLISNLEDEQIPSLLTEARTGGNWGSSITVVEYNGSKMASCSYSNGMNGILFNMYSNIPTGANYLAIDIYTSGEPRYNFQHYVYKTGRSAFNNWFTGPQVTEQIARTVYISLAQVSEEYPLFSVQMNIASGSGTIYYDNIRFTKTNSELEVPSTDPAPEIIEPAINSVKYEKEITFCWAEAQFAQSYNLYLYTDEACEDLITSFVGLTTTSHVVDLTGILTSSQKIYWKATSISMVDGEESTVPNTGYFTYSDYIYSQFSPVTFQEDGLANVAWRNNTNGANWNDMTTADLVQLPNGKTAYQTGTVSGTYLFGVRQMFSAGEMSSEIYDTIAFTLSSDYPGTYTYRVWIYSSGGSNYELTSQSGVQITIGKTSTTFYRKLSFSESVTKDNMVGYAVQLMGNQNPVYFHSMGIMDLSYSGSITPIEAEDFVLDKGAATLNGTLDWEDLDALTGEYYIQLWYVFSGYTIWFVGGETVYQSSMQLDDKDMSEYSSYFNFFTQGQYVINYKITAKNSLNDAGTTTFEGTININLIVT